MLHPFSKSERSARASVVVVDEMAGAVLAGGCPVADGRWTLLSSCLGATKGFDLRRAAFRQKTGANSETIGTLAPAVNGAARLQAVVDAYRTYVSDTDPAANAEILRARTLLKELGGVVHGIFGQC